MNKIFKLIWNVVSKTWVAVAETCTTRGSTRAISGSSVAADKRLANSKKHSLSVGTLVCLAYCAPLAAQSPSSNAVPKSGKVVSGKASIESQPQSLNINQNSQRAIIDWKSFDVGSDAVVRFQQPNASSSTLNRVTGGKTSQIFGRIEANGQVFLSNPSGAYFAPGAHVDVGSFAATTHSIENSDFMDGGTDTWTRNNSTGTILNEGTIASSLGGYVALLAPEVRNKGIILAQLGSVRLAAGERMQLSFSDAGNLVNMQVEAATIDTLIENRHLVQAQGGLILLSSRALNQLQSEIINSGDLDASSMVSRGGKIYLESSSIDIQTDSRLDASGATGGGEVLVGGDWQGAGSLHQANSVTMAQGASIDVSAKQNGQGGKAVLWSDINHKNSRTQAYGSIKARGGTLGGDGGQVETSGAELLHDNLLVDAGADHGEGGLWLLDPDTVTINQTSANGYASTLNTGTDVLVEAGITLNLDNNVNITKTAGSEATLTLRSGVGVYLRSGSSVTSSSDKLNLVLHSGYSNTADKGRVHIDNATIDTNGGHLNASGGDTTEVWNGLTVGNDYATATLNTQRAGVDIINSTISSGSGEIRLVGKSEQANTAAPANLAAGVYITNSDISSTQGDINIAGTTAGALLTGAGVMHRGGNITSQDGSIYIRGEGTNVTSQSGWRHGIALAADSSINIHSDTGSVTLVGHADYTDHTNDSVGLVYQRSGSNYINTTSDSGTVSLQGTSTTSNSVANSQLKGIALRSSGTANLLRIGDDGSNTSTANIGISADALSVTDNGLIDGVRITSKGTLSITPSDDSFVEDININDHWNLGTELTDINIGQESNTSDITLNTDLDFKGSLSAYGSNITASGRYSSSADDDSIFMLKSKDRMSLGGTTIEALGTGKLDTILWAEADGGSTTGVYAGAGATVNTAGGHLWIGGGDTDTVWNDLTVGNSTVGGSDGNNHNGIDLNGSFNTAGGDIYMAGATQKDTGSGIVVGYSGAATLDAGTGDITLVSDKMQVHSASSVSGTGTLTIRPASSNSTVSVGSTAGDLSLVSSLFEGVNRVLQDGFSHITIGDQTAGDVTIGGSTTLSDSATVISGHDIVIEAGGTLTTTQDSGELLIVAINNFLNNSSAGAVSATGSGGDERWAVYSKNPEGNQFGGLQSGQKALWGKDYVTTPSSELPLGNRYVFSDDGQISVGSVSGSPQNKIYGDTVNLADALELTGAPLNPEDHDNAYLAEDLTEVFALQPEFQSAASAKNADVGSYTVEATQAQTQDGFSFSDGTVTGATVEVTPRSLTIAALSQSKRHDGTTDSDVTPRYGALVTGDSVSGLSQSFDSADVGSRTLSITSYQIDDGNNGANYNVATTSADGSIIEAATEQTNFSNPQPTAPIPTENLGANTTSSAVDIELAAIEKLDKQSFSANNTVVEVVSEPFSDETPLQLGAAAVPATGALSKSAAVLKSAPTEQRPTSFKVSVPRRVYRNNHNIARIGMPSNLQAMITRVSTIELRHASGERLPAWFNANDNTLVLPTTLVNKTKLPLALKITIDGQDYPLEIKKPHH